MVRAPLITVLVFGAVIRRLLGVPLGLVRTVFAAALAYVIAGPLLAAFVPSPEVDTGTALLYTALAIAGASLAAMSGVVVAEVVVPDGSVPGPIEL